MWKRGWKSKFLIYQLSISQSGLKGLLDIQSVQMTNITSFFRFPICEATNGKETTGLAGVVNKGLGLAEKGLQQVGLSTDQVS